MSTFAASNLPPALPEKAAWGTAGSLRAWQQQALELYFREIPRDFLTVATPGAGKTTFALRLARELLDRRAVQGITILCPTEHLKRQWAESAARVGIKIDPEFTNAMGKTAKDFHGVAVTYATVAARPALHRNRTEARKTLIIMDEVHHAGDGLSWGDAVREAFEPATKRLALSGTPFRTDINPIPFVEYEEGPDGIRRSRSDYTYGYGPALADGVVRPVMFMAYSGEMRWRTRAGDELAASLGQPLTQDQTAQAWRAALDPKGDWIRQVIEAADRRLTEVRKGMPDAGAMVIATDHEAARAYAKMIRGITGQGATIVLSDDPKASKKIKQFADSEDRWLCAVRMVSEGVDIPRLAVGVYATSTATPLFFAQAIGRFVRARKRGETASVFLPSVPTLMGHASEMETERDHVLDRRTREQDGFDDDALEQANRKNDGADLSEELPFETMEASATFDRVLYDGGEFGMQAAPGSAEEEDFLGIPGLLEPEQVTALLRQHQANQIAAQRKRGVADPEPVERTASEDLQGLRQELNGLVGAWSHRTGKPHGVVHTELRASCGGPAVPQASAKDVQARIDKIREWAARRT
ncbi:DEAD/DEAH box helicase [Actinocorallia longicatena]|uniref:DEAD/DEAH box helicase n=1 Tax=Actinocorallia longicatena TaxID=111803 RepID=A0ABP6QI91_9ACTN